MPLQNKVVPTSVSIDDVMRIVDTDEADMVVEQCKRALKRPFSDHSHGVIS